MARHQAQIRQVEAGRSGLFPRREGNKIPEEKEDNRVQNISVKRWWIGGGGGERKDTEGKGK